MFPLVDLDALRQKIAGLENSSPGGISRLPVEIIAEVFLEGKRRAQHQDLFAEARGWLNVTQVCHLWREVALSIPQLWSSINLTSVSHDRVMEMLARSKSAPLQIRFMTDAHAIEDLRQSNTAASVVMSQLGRMQGLDIQADSPELLIRFLQSTVNTNAPLLEDLRLTSKSEVFSITTSVLRCEMPSLRVLTVRGGIVSPAPELPIFAHLARLVLTAAVPAGYGQQVSQLVQFLRHVPYVEDVSVSGLIPDASTQYLMVAKTTLPKLSHLAILSPDIHSSQIFNYLEHPNATCIQFVVQSPPQFSLGADLSSLYRACSRFSSCVGDGVSIMCAQITVSTSTFKLSLHCKTSGHPSLWHFSFSLPMPFPHMTSSYVHLCSALPLTEVPALILTGFKDMPHPEWRQLARLFDRVRSLTFVRCDEEVVDAFLKNDTLWQVPLPTLRTINFNECHVIHDDVLDSPWRQWGVVLKDCFAERKRVFGVCVAMYWDYVCITDEVSEGCDLVGSLYSLDGRSVYELDL